MTRTVVIGGGIMGGGIALALVRAGHVVTVVEPDETTASMLAERLADDPWTSSRDPAEVTPELDAVSTAEFVIEAAPEDLDLKIRLWRKLGEIAPDGAILATNTSSLDVDLLAAGVPEPQRVIVTHWFNPAYEVECVEVAPGLMTSAEVLENTLSMLRGAGKRPVVVPNVAGFVANRVQFAAIREALLCVAEGIPPSDVDEVVRTSFAARLAALGPLANADLGGLDTYLAIFEVLQNAHGERFSPPDFLSRLVGDGHLGVKNGAGVFEYTPSSAAALAELRDARLSRIISAVARVEAG